MEENKELEVEETVEEVEELDPIAVVAPPKIEAPVFEPQEVSVESDEEDDGILKPIEEKKEEEEDLSVAHINNTIFGNSELNSLKDTTTPQEEVDSTATLITPEVKPDVPVQTDAAPATTEEPLLENKKMKSVDIEYKEPSAFKLIIGVLLFAILLLSVIYIDQINAFINSGKVITEETEFKDFSPSGDIVTEEKEVPNGTLTCTKEDSDNSYDYSYVMTFDFTDFKLTALKYTDTIKGSENYDYDYFKKLKTNCDKLNRDLETGEYGDHVTCDLYQSSYSMSHSIDYSKLKEADVVAAYVRYELEWKTYKANDDIRSIMSSLKAEKYTCQVEEFDGNTESEEEVVE